LFWTKNTDGDAAILLSFFCGVSCDRLEIVLCDECCDPEDPYQDEQVIHIQRSVAARAKLAIDRMFEIT